ncbi:MAG: AmmeMemoRadiSam system protein B [Bryobacteraceae bacterium]
MAKPLAPLRRDLDFFPSPDRGHPGLVIQDRNRFSDRQLVVQPALVQILDLFDGQNTALDLRAALTRLTGELETGEVAGQLESALSEAGFLEDDNFAAIREARLRVWRAADVLPHSHSGPLNYPGDSAALHAQFDNWFRSVPKPEARKVRAIAAPHASPGAASRSYAAAYAALAQSLSKEEAAGKTFVILGTSHYGEMDRLGTTRKDFETPVGRAPVNGALLAELKREGGAGVLEEDYFFSLEHSVEFQVVFLQYLYGPDVKILPLLCGSYARSIYLGGPPEKSDEVRRYIDALRGLETRHGDELVWILGVDMAHVGKRYDDDAPATAHAGAMLEVEQRDRRRIHSLSTGDTGVFWAQIQEGGDPLKWCGSAPFYTFLRAMPAARGELLDYEHWQIDPQSVVTFGAMRFV